MRISDRILARWCVATVALIGAAIAFDSSGIVWTSRLGLVVRGAMGLVTAAIAIGFYVVMFIEVTRKEMGMRKVIAIVVFLLTPVISAILYFWWTRYIRTNGAS